MAVLSALAFLTVVGRGHPPNDRTLRWFPVVGALLGATVAASFAGAQRLWTMPVAAGLALAVDAAATGLLHIDGLADSADGLLPHMDRERRLVVMRAPDTGAFAVGVVVLVIVMRWATLASGVSPWTVAALWCASRSVVAAVPTVVSYARPEGLASPFIVGARWWTALALVPAGVLGWWAQGWRGMAAVFAVVAGVSLVVGRAKRCLGGFTGDVLGAAIVVGETAGLLVAAVTR